jgi:ABC-type amino acid transport substrate-binding protein
VNATTTYHIALGSPGPWLKICQILFDEIAKNIPDTKFIIHKIPSKRVIPDLEKGKIDGEVGWLKSNITSKKVIATDESLVELYFTVITKKQKVFKDKTWSDLNGLSIAYPRGAHYIHHKIPKDSRYEVNRLEQSFSLLDAGRIDGLVTTIQNFKNIMKKSANEEYKIIDHLSYHVKLHPIFNIKDKKLRDDVNKSIILMKKSGTYQKLQKRTGLNLLEKEVTRP